MKTTNRSILRLSKLAGYGMLVFSILACQALAGGTPAPEGTMQLDDGMVKVKADTGDWVPVAGKATFELVGKLDDTDPWIVSGQTLTTNETTQIDEGLQTGDTVRVRGAVLDDDTWVAYFIEKVDEQTEPIIILIGVVDSVDPWVVNGITLIVTDETDIQGEIAVGMVVRVEILLLEDGTWEVLSITLLGETTEDSGCVTVIATVVSMSGGELQFLGWPDTVTFMPDQQTANENNQGEDDDEDDEDDEGGGVTVSVGQTVTAVVCVSEDGQLIIVQIIILIPGESANDMEGGKVLVCHKPNKKGGHTLSLPQSAVPAHLGHGDTLGACP